MKKEIPLGDDKYFELFIGKRILKKDVFQSTGDIPVYSGSVVTPFGLVKKSNIDDFQHEYIIWGIDDAVFDFALIPKGTKFATTDHCGVIKIKDNAILPEYVFYELQLKKKALGFGWALRASLTNMKKEAVLSIPIKKNGDFDLNEQRRLAEKYKKIRNVFTRIEDIHNELKTITLKIDIKSDHVLQIPIGKIFDLSLKTNHSKFTKKFVNKNKGTIPVYSASKDENSIDYGFVKDNLKGIKYFENCLTWNIDGSVGKAFFRKDRFSLSEKVIPLILQDQYKDNIDYEYVKFMLEEKVLEYGFHFSHKAGKSKIENILIPFPSVKNGDEIKPDLNRQKEIASIHKKVDGIKTNVSNKIYELIDTNILVSIA